MMHTPYTSQKIQSHSRSERKSTILHSLNRKRNPNWTTEGDILQQYEKKRFLLYTFISQGFFMCHYSSSSLVLKGKPDSQITNENDFSVICL